MSSLRASPTVTTVGPRPARGGWLALAAAVLVLVGLDLALSHVVLAPAADHDDCLVCQGVHHLVPAVAAAVILVLAICALRPAEPRLAPGGRRPLPFRGRAPPSRLFA